MQQLTWLPAQWVDVLSLQQNPITKTVSLHYMESTARFSSAASFVQVQSDACGYWQHALTHQEYASAHFVLQQEAQLTTVSPMPKEMRPPQPAILKEAVNEAELPCNHKGDAMPTSSEKCLKRAGSSNVRYNEEL